MTAVAATLLLFSTLGSEKPSTQAKIEKEKQGVITGFVFADGNAGLEGAQVVAIRTDGTGEALATVTDSQGHYSLTVGYGEYKVVGMKEDQEYPDCRLALFSCLGSPVRIEGTSPNGSVNIRVAKAARINGEIVDRATGNEMAGTSLLVRRGDDYFKAYTTTNPKPTFSILVPSEIELTLTVVAVKYRVWRYRDPHTNFATLRLAPGSEAKIKVQMDRVEP